MSHRFPLLRPPAANARKTVPGSALSASPTIADLCLVGALVLSLALALI